MAKVTNNMLKFATPPWPVNPACPPSSHAHCSHSSGGAAYCVEYRGDWKWQRESFGLSAHWGGVNFCHVCTAKGRGGLMGRCLTLLLVFFGGQTPDIMCFTKGSANQVDQIQSYIPEKKLCQCNCQLFQAWGSKMYRTEMFCNLHHQNTLPHH